MSHHLWQAIAAAEEAPTMARLDQIWKLLDAELQTLSEAEQLTVGAEVLQRMAEILTVRAEQWINEWENRGVVAEPVLDDLFGLVRLSVDLELEPFLEPIPLDTHHPTPDTRHPTPDTQPETLNSELTPINLLDLAGREQPELWTQAIAQYFEQVAVAEVSLLELQAALQMPVVELWLGLLLGGYSLKQAGDFYDSTTITIARNRQHANHSAQ